MKNDMVTLKDIAERTGLSVNTVSRALRDKDDISESTRRRVRAVAREMGYMHNALASSLRQGQTDTIAVIVGDISNPFFSWHVSEIERFARGYGYITYMINTEEDETLELRAIKNSLQRKVDGIIIAPSQHTMGNILYLQENNVPFVLLGRRFKDISVPYVIQDDRRGGYLATKHLIENGHRDILSVHGPHYISSAEERLQGYADALAEYGIRQNPDLIRGVSAIPGNCKKVASAIAGGEIPCTGIVVYSDVLALEIWYLLKQMGKRVPQDYSIVGFDNIYSRCCAPYQLTSIGTTANLASSTVDMLVRLIRQRKGEQGGAETEKILDVKLIQGESSGPRPDCF
ncbi:MAG TPA: LacI family DNA-binding transcriptional regulator [Clostridia bacterium]|nr:LacI family DNA-binding transcriptional regulator [Clostridia bacterium]